jgi:hypothetical protein
LENGLNSIQYPKTQKVNELKMRNRCVTTNKHPTPQEQNKILICANNSRKGNGPHSHTSEKEIRKISNYLRTRN